MISSALLLFLLGSSGLFLFRNNIIVVLMGIELMLFSVNLLFVLLSFSIDDLFGQLFSLFILTVAAAESALGLALLVVYYRLRGVVSIDYISALKGLWSPFYFYFRFLALLSPFSLVLCLEVVGPQS